MVATGQPTRSALQLSVYGLELLVESDWPEVLDAVRLDFTWFAAPDADHHRRTDVRVVVERREPEYQGFADVPAVFVTPRNVVYQAPNATIVDYFGRALSVRDRATGDIAIRGEDAGIVHEAVYQFLLSRLGEHFDRIGMPRIHGLGLTGEQGGVVVMLPSGGGKTTLAIRALKDHDVKLLSDDSPLLDRHNLLHPFPLRLGINETDAAVLPPGHVRRIERSEFHPKLALELEAVLDRIASEPSPFRHLVIGRRSLAATGRLERLPRRRAASTLFREAVVGVGIYQGMEFVLQRGMRDVLGKTGVALTRSVRCAAALARTDVWLLTLGRDHGSNWNALAPLFK